MTTVVPKTARSWDFASHSIALPSVHNLRGLPQTLA
jgi:hypothetical protein